MAETRANRLAREKSPYLRQHGADPVDWYPWGEEAFERARSEDKPIFLSIGYSTCHWCHVMGRESFADPEVAALLNGGFVAVKVDREERPDLDQHYMAVCESLTGSGGWPLTILLTPDLRPFFAGTYYPRSRQWGRPGLLEILGPIVEGWRADRREILRSADEVGAAVERGLLRLRRQRGDRLTAATLDEAARELAADFDRARGGFGGPPKFPVAHRIGFLLRYWQRTGRGEALGMAGKTLQAMRRGGVFDQIGFGFHRYATDPDWLVPHFEKMLTDQALLAEVYAQAFAATGRSEFRKTAVEIADYVLRELRSPDGGFYTAEDSDSEGEEGRYYLWTRADLDSVLGAEEAEVAAAAYGVGGPDGPDGPGGVGGGRYVLRDAGPGARQAPEARLEAIRRKLLLAREQRVPPFKDTKVLADGNGLMIAGLAAVFRVTGEDRYRRAAAEAADFILDRMRGAAGRLHHVFAGGQAAGPGFLGDYAFMIKGLAALYGAGFAPRYLEAALGLVDAAVELFWDDAEGGFFFGAEADAGPRRKDVHDGAVPSGNSVMFMDLLRLSRLTGRPGLEDRASRLAESVAAEILGHPRASTEFLCGLDYAVGPSREIVIAGASDAGETRALLEAARQTCVWDDAVLFKPADDPGTARAVERLAPFTAGLGPGEGPAAAYVCSGGACLRPVTTAEELAEALAGPPAVTRERPRTRP